MTGMRMKLDLLRCDRRRRRNRNRDADLIEKCWWRWRWLCRRCQGNLQPVDASSPVTDQGLPCSCQRRWVAGGGRKGAGVRLVTEKAGQTGTIGELEVSPELVIVVVDDGSLAINLLGAAGRLWKK